MSKRIALLTVLSFLISMGLYGCGAPAAEQPTMAPPAATEAPAAAPATEAPAAPATEAPAAGKCAPEDIRLLQSMREIDQPYHAAVDAGGRLFAEWAGFSEDQYVLQLNLADTDRQVSEARAILATNPECTILNVEPNSDVADVLLADVVNETGAYMVTHWDPPAGVYPFDVSDHWIANVSVPGVEVGYQIAVGLFNAMGGQGNIVAFEGFQEVQIAHDLYTGLEKALAEYPGITLLAHQPADWDRTKSFPIMEAWLAQYGDQINGVWAGNDDMAIGALEALRAAGLAGKIPLVGFNAIPEALNAVANGEMVMTATSDAAYQGSIGFAMGYCILTGKVPPPEEGAHEQRMFFLTPVMIDSSNVDSFLAPPAASDYEGDWSCEGLWDRSIGPSFQQ
jgi:ribose transport system substrate-binding protein